MQTAQVHPEPETETAGNGAACKIGGAAPTDKLPAPGGSNGSPKGSPTWGRANGDGVNLQSTLQELELLHTDKQMNALRKELDKEAKELLQSSKGAHLKEKMGVKRYLESRPEADDCSWEMTR